MIFVGQVLCWAASGLLEIHWDDAPPSLKPKGYCWLLWKQTICLYK